MKTKKLVAVIAAVSAGIGAAITGVVLYRKNTSTDAEQQIHSSIRK